MASIRKATDEIITINVGGKKFTTRRSTLSADPSSKLGDWFRNSGSRSVPQDRAGNYFLDRDGKTFRYILAYLRCKKERSVGSFGLPLKPDELSKLIAECDALRMEELKDLCMEMLQRYSREEHNYVAAYVNNMLREYENMFYAKKGMTSVADDDPYAYNSYGATDVIAP